MLCHSRTFGCLVVGCGVGAHPGGVCAAFPGMSGVGVVDGGAAGSSSSLEISSKSIASSRGFTRPAPASSAGMPKSAVKAATGFPSCRQPASSGSSVGACSIMITVTHGVKRWYWRWELLRCGCAACSKPWHVPACHLLRAVRHRSELSSKCVNHCLPWLFICVPSW